MTNTEYPHGSCSECGGRLDPDSEAGIIVLRCKGCFEIEKEAVEL